MKKIYDVAAMGELLIDFTMNGISGQGNQLFEACPGGAPCNVLSMVSRLGRKAVFLGKVGADQFGYLLKDTIDSLGIVSSEVVFDREIPTTLAFVHTLRDGDREFSFYRKPGADLMLTEQDVNYDVIRQSRVFYFGTVAMTEEPVRSAVVKAVETAKEAGTVTVFDPNYRKPLWRTVGEAKEQMRYGFSRCDILKISDNEIKLATGMESYEDGVRMLQETYRIPLILLTMGKDGSCAFYQGMKVYREGKTVEAIDATGAGDTFCGCCIHQLLDCGLQNLDEEKLAEMLTFANAAAALITQRKGALKSMPGLEEIQIMAASVLKREAYAEEVLR